ncbi:unnamed protein product [Gongylonema pulchrum]|uniref:FH2 domain-containing protein n=1 Tax=Gongylonema pulchrum TaxID=637853 RepID=A0A183D3N7_9BILA|nr:unnamed protein product [Gongylonema pulchrum]
MDLTNAASTLLESLEFKIILRIVTVCCNYALGDFSAETVCGYRASALIDICSLELPTTPKTTMLSVVAETISEHFPVVEKFGDVLSAVEKAAKGYF